MKDFKKITEDNFEEFVEDSYKNWLSDRVSTFLIGNSADHESRLEESLIGCESPIEQLLALEFENIKLEYIHRFNPFVDVVGIDKQEIVEAKGNKYRVDFLIPVVYKNRDNLMYVVECDGYDFHQKTKKQVEDDNKRQRDLQEAGYEVIRFSGTEIYHKPNQCALTVKNIILSKCKYIKDE